MFGWLPMLLVAVRTYPPVWLNQEHPGIRTPDRRFGVPLPSHPLSKVGRTENFLRLQVLRLQVLRLQVLNTISLVADR